MYKKNLLSDSILISKGSAHGVKAGDPIVRENRLVGKIIDVNYASSKAILLTNIRSRIPVNVGEKSHRAILVGNPNIEGGISLEFLPKNVKFNNGCLLNFELSYVLNTDREFSKIEIFGTKGYISWPDGKLMLIKANKKMFI